MNNSELFACYHQIDALLTKLDFSALWPLFHRFPFALYTNDTVLLDGQAFPRDERFLGNTAIEAGGRFIAIWQCEDGQQLGARLAASIVHEMFHAFQKEQGDMRFPNDLIALSYPKDAECVQLRLREGQLAAKAVCSASSEEVIPLLCEIVALRRVRKRRIGLELYDCENRFETIEGTAEFVGLMALKALDPAAYANALLDCAERLTSPSVLLTDLRRSCYDSGVLLLCAAEKAGLIPQLAKERSKPHFDRLMELLPTVPFEPFTPDPCIGELLHTAIKEKQARIDAFLSVPRMRYVGPFTIVGYDPMNMELCASQLYCNNFLMLQDAKGETRCIKGPLLADCGESMEQVTAYYL